jgi:hypothetical protein
MLTKLLIALSLALTLGIVSLQVAVAQQAGGSRVQASPRISEPEYMRYQTCAAAGWDGIRCSAR